MKKLYMTLILVLIASVAPRYLSSEEFVHQSVVEAGIIYDYLTPEDVYDDWKSFEIRYTNKFNPTTTLTTAGGLSSRDVKLGWYQAGIYKDWLPRLYTFTAATTATPSAWMAKWRLDNDFNIKFGSEKQYILALGQTAMYYTDDREDYILSIGGIWYRTHFVADARYFFNWSEPGSVESTSARLSLGFGTRGKTWTTISAGLGTQAYLGLGSQVAINQDISSISLTEQIWLKRNCGIKLGVGYHKIENGYEKYNASFGWFYQIP